MSFQDLSLSKKMTIMILAISGFMIIVISAIFVVNEAISVHRSVFHNMSAIAGITALNSTAALSFNDPDTAAEILQALKAEPHVAAAAIYRADGTLFAKSVMMPDAVLPERIDMKSLELSDDRDGDINPLLSIFRDLTKDYFHLAKPITLNGKVIGAVYVLADQSWVYGQLRLFIFMVICIVVALILFSYFLSSKIQRIISMPIEQLARTMELIENKQDFSIRVRSEDRNDELGMLMKGFNNMLEQIQKRDHWLERNREQLERQVKLRTEALKLSEAQKKKLWLQKRIQQAYGDLVSKMHSINIDEMLGNILHQISETASMTWGCVFLLDDQGRLQIKKTFSAELLEHWSQKCPEVTASLEQMAAGLAQKALARNKAVSESWSEQPDRGFFTQLESYAFPLTFHDKKIGVLVLTGPRQPDEYTMGFLENASRQLGVALHNAITFENLKEKTAQLKQSNLELQRVSRMKSDFLANMSHELRTPLNAIIGFSEILLDQHFGELNEVQQDYLTDVLESGRHLLSLINDILDLSKVEAGKVELSLSEIPIESLLHGSLGMIRYKALNHNISLSVNIGSIPDRVVADERRLKQILFNLVSNAVKFTDDGGSIEIHADTVTRDWLQKNVPSIFGPELKELLKRGGDRFLKISVKDTGIGIEEGHMKKIFEAFEQVDSSRAKKFEGTGLGLALCKNFVEMHGGMIWAESSPAEGSTFSFVLPLDRQNLQDLPGE